MHLGVACPLSRKHQEFSGMDVRVNEVIPLSTAGILPHDALQSMSSAAHRHLWVATSPLYPPHPPAVAVESGRISQGFQAA